MYPENAGELAALIAALVPLAIWAFSSMITAVAKLLDSRREAWRRLTCLVTVLYNKDHEYGQWRQILAARELGEYRTHRGVIHEIANIASEHFSGQDDSFPVIAELKKIVSRNQP
tara:strand:- start:4253 stop:4597 length:345 start_codon:yes stop_codon:yes gene_type:complete